MVHAGSDWYRSRDETASVITYLTAAAGSWFGGDIFVLADLGNLCPIGCGFVVGAVRRVSCKRSFRAWSQTVRGAGMSDSTE